MGKEVIVSQNHLQFTARFCPMSDVLFASFGISQMDQHIKGLFLFHDPLEISIFSVRITDNQYFHPLFPSFILRHSPTCHRNLLLQRALHGL